MSRYYASFAALVAVLVMPAYASAFCGFFVGSASTELYNDASRVVLMRHDKKTIVSMQNQYRGPTEDFAMVVPVPEVLQKDDVKILEDEVFDKVDSLSAPRLVEYWEVDPCGEPPGGGIPTGVTIGSGRGTGSGYGAGDGKQRVVIEAQFAAGEYDIVVLSSNESGALEAWLKEHEYKIPDGAAEYFEPYVASGSYFFVAKVARDRVKFEDGEAVLSPIRFHYEDDGFRLPVRLGLINSDGQQDLLVYILALDQRYEVANYPNEFVPTNLEVSATVKDDFGGFYESLFTRAHAANPKAVFTEYAWPAGNGKCDPCPPENRGLTPRDFYTLGADVIGGFEATHNVIPSGKPTVEGPLDAAIIRRIFRRYRRNLSDCMASDPSASAIQFTADFVIEPDGTVTGVELDGPFENQPDMQSCFVDRLSKFRFPEPKGGGRVKVSYPFAGQFIAVGAGNFGGRLFPGQWVLTRLHARYDAESLGEDLVFRKASPVTGGRPSKEPNYGAVEGPWNSFQGRYIVRNEWDGAIECDDPVRGRWREPSEADLLGEIAMQSSRKKSKFEAADLESVIEKGPELPDAVATKPEPSEDDGADAKATPAPDSAPAGSCECASSGGPMPFSWVFVALVFMGIRRRFASSNNR